MPISARGGFLNMTDSRTLAVKGIPMVHILADHLRSEFLAVPQLVRFDMPLGEDGREPTLLIKANSLCLKYLLRRRAMRLVISKVGDKILYGVEIPDDPQFPAMVWSLMGEPAEVAALEALAANPRCVIFLFNELAVSVAWTELEVRISPALARIAGEAERHSSHDPTGTGLVAKKLSEIRTQAAVPNTQMFDFAGIEWHELKADYITNSLAVSGLSLFSDDEGGQQEEIAVWLTDSLHPKGCVKSPQLQAKPVREMTDVLLSYEFGLFLIESKALNILTRQALPDRAKLESDLRGHIEKASKQLAGAVRALADGTVVKDGAGRVLELNRTKIHSIVLVPDLGLLADAQQFGAEFVVTFMKKARGFLHILDPAELLRVVQAAEMIAERSSELTSMMAFDLYLMRRAQRAVTSPTPGFEILYRPE